MISICESYLDQYATTVEEDEKLMRDRAMFKLFSRQTRMAIKLRASEKRILQQTIVAIEDELKKLPSIVINDQIAPAGRSFDVLAKKATVSNAKSAMDWVDMKGEKAKSSASTEAGDSKDEKLSIAERRRRRRG